jgi:hypothetical protein
MGRFWAALADVVAEAAWESQLWNLGRQNGLRLTLQLQFLF